MSKLTLDEAIKHCEEVAEELEKKANIYKVKNTYLPDSQEPVNCLSCAAEHRQLAEWLMEYKDLKAEQNDQYVYINELMRELKTRRTQFEKICIELSELFGCPCNFSPMDEIMIEAEGCVEDCGDVTDSECWRRYFKTKGVEYLDD